MPTLPTPGGDTDTWGTELNEYLLVAHNADGTAKGAPGSFELAGAVSAGVSSITLNEAPSWMTGQRVSVIIDRYTANAETRIATTISGSIVTLLTVLKNAHAAGATVEVVREVSPIDYGAKGDNTTTDTVAIQACLDDVVMNSAGVTAINGLGRSYRIDKPIYATNGHTLKSLNLYATTGGTAFSPAEATNAMLITCQDTPRRFTVDAATNTITTDAVHSLGGVNVRVAFKGTALPAPLVAGRTYYAKTIPTTTSLTLSETSGGAEIDLTTTDNTGIMYCELNGTERVFLDDVYLNGGNVPGLNGISAMLQQPCRWHKVRVDDCPGIGVQLAGQDGEITNLEVLRCDIGIDIGRTLGTATAASMFKFYNLDPEQCVTAGVKTTNAAGTAIFGLHVESTPIGVWIPSGGGCFGLGLYSPWITGQRLIKNETDNNSCAYSIFSYRRYGVAGTDILIEDVTRAKNLLSNELPDTSYMGTIGVFIQKAGPTFGFVVDGLANVARARTSSSLAFGTVAANNMAIQTITVTGLDTGKAVAASPEGNPGTGLVWSARCSAANTLEIRMANPTTSPIVSSNWNWNITYA